MFKITELIKVRGDKYLKVGHFGNLFGGVFYKIIPEISHFMMYHVICNNLISLAYNQKNLKFPRFVNNNAT